jgi:hydroxyacylglutathione hydrolase
MPAWTGAGEDTASIALTRAAGFNGRRVLDIRQRSEYVEGHLPGAVHVELGDLPARAADITDEPTIVMCGHGERAMGAASLLERAGHRDLAVLDGGPEDWAEATEGKLTTGL